MNLKKAEVIPITASQGKKELATTNRGRRRFYEESWDESHRESTGDTLPVKFLGVCLVGLAIAISAPFVFMNSDSSAKQKVQSLQAEIETIKTENARIKSCVTGG